jgi:DGQHR domain-containing protein
MNSKPNDSLVLRALRIIQGPERPIYSFCLRAGQIFQIADISRVSRSEAGDLIGYQRPEVRQHIEEIIEYLESKEVIFPNPIIMALPSTIKFVAARGPMVGDGSATIGTLRIPLAAEDKPRSGWIVDGQQRALALTRSGNQELAVPINAFVTDSIDIQRDQFVRINNSKPLPRGLVTELLPTISNPLPTRLALRQTPSALCDLLNSDPDSPFCGLIRRSSKSAEVSQAVIADTSVVNMVKESLTTSSGCLFPFRDQSSGETNFTAVWKILITYWTAVKMCFPEAWAKSPSDSRLMHGVGIRSMGRLMDHLMPHVDIRRDDCTAQALAELATIAPFCHWSSGTWSEIDLRWNELQNVPRHTNQLTSYLVRTYVRAKTDSK